MDEVLINKTLEQWFIELQPFFLKWQSFRKKHPYAGNCYGWWLGRLVDDFPTHTIYQTPENIERLKTFKDVFFKYELIIVKQNYPQKRWVNRNNAGPGETINAER